MPDIGLTRGRSARRRYRLRGIDEEALAPWNGIPSWLGLVHRRRYGAGLVSDREPIGPTRTLALGGELVEVDRRVRGDLHAGGSEHNVFRLDT